MSWRDFSMTREERIKEGYKLYNRYSNDPGMQTRILAKLDEHSITKDDFARYDSTAAAERNINLLESRSEKLEDIPYFSQSKEISDVEILRIFESKQKLEDQLEEIGEPPVEADWFKKGWAADVRYDLLKPQLDIMMEEEWAQLEHPFDPIAPFMGPVGLLTDIIAGGLDWRHEFKEDLHEKGLGTSYNPLTGFGAWDIAEFKQNVSTGQRGFSPKLLALEEEIEGLAETRTTFREKFYEGGWDRRGAVEKEIEELQIMINEQQLIDPRLLGEY